MTATDPNFPLVSFVIPVRDDAERLRRCLRSIRSNRFPEQRVEVIVVDNGSTDRSAEVARSVNAITLDASGCNVASLRNLGARLARGQILAFVDADHEIVHTWLSSAVETLRRPRVAAVGATYTPPPQGTWVQRLYGALRGQTEGCGTVEWLGSGNLAIWREAFENIGGFDTSLETCEDVDLCLRLRRSGYELIGDERLRTIHHGDPATLWTLLYGEMWRGRDNLRVSLRGPLSWRGMPSLLIPIAHLALGSDRDCEPGVLWGMEPDDLVQFPAPDRCPDGAAGDQASDEPWRLETALHCSGLRCGGDV